MKTFKQLIEARNADTAGAVVMGIIGVGILGMYVAGLIPLPAFLAVIFR